MIKNLICPVSNEKIDSYVSQLTIFFSVILVVSFMLAWQPVFLYIAAFDYGIRAFTNGNLSPLKAIAILVSRLFKWKPKMIDKAPKVFASRLGFLCLLASSILINVGLPSASVVIAIMATSLFLLDALGIICVGCVIYHHFVFPFYQKQKLTK